MSSGFVTESEIAEARRQRQEEWDRVRNADQPIEAPEEPYDGRSLFDRLQEQKQKKDLEYEEAHKLKNMIKGLDDDEIEFLDLVDRTKLAAERKKNIDEERELNEYRNRVATLQEKSLDQRLQAEIAVTTKPKNVVTTRQSQMKLLKGAVVTKVEPKKRKHSESDNDNESPIKNGKISEPVQTSGKRKFDEIELNNVSENIQGAMKCIGILPGLGCYNDSSESDYSSDSETEHDCVKIDILGRKIKKVEKQE